MNELASPTLSLEPAAEEFLKRHNALASFQAACDLVRDCFPQARAINVWLQEDPDEENHTWVVLEAVLPPGHPEQLRRTQELRYHEELVRRPSLPYHPLSFSLNLNMGSD